MEVVHILRGDGAGVCMKDDSILNGGSYDGEGYRGQRIYPVSPNNPRRVSVIDIA